MDASNFVLSGDFGYVVLVMIFSVFVLMWMGFKVGAARKKYEVPYPAMYSNDDRFNCVQRAHQNTLENYPSYLLMQVLSGLFAPKIAAVSGVIWCVGKIFYARGYYTGDPSKRIQGSFAYIGLLIMLVCSVLFGLNLLKITNL
ncbi:microsomal glutathione S-transferase 3-like [Ostrea edulis]|uniref:microsomal glutathione S-transferase 3-like n=1 Tax=Ostrea edulis TaxID=37623 RepID=UPI0020945915|nr:microsomal glutathione S-transferase 3-like [Ostrea edulis]